MKITPEVKQIAAWLRSLDAPPYFYGISYEELAMCIEQGLDPKSAILNHVAPETVAVRVESKADSGRWVDDGE